MILKANQIANRMLSEDEEDKKDPLVITPFPNIDELKKSGAASVDLRLGTWFSTLRQSRIPVLEVDDELANAARRAGVTPEQLRIIEEFYRHPRLPAKQISLSRIMYHLAVALSSTRRTSSWELRWSGSGCLRT